jgi:cell division protein FtsQ
LKPIETIQPIVRERSLAVRTGLPVPIRRRGGVMVRLANLWVLHRRMALRSIIVLVLIGAGIAGYLLRDEMSEGATVVSHLVTGRMAEAGFGVAQIEITGQALTREADVMRALRVEDFTNTLAFDAEAARLRVEEIPSVETATIRKIYPDSITVTITEKEPVARWRIDGLTMLVDKRGQPIAPASFENGDLTLVIGEGAGDDALAMVTLMRRFPDLSTDLAALSRIADRRWDLIYYSGLRVQLPEQGVVGALDRLNVYHRDHMLLDRDVDLIDMRIPQYVAVRPIIRDET